VTKEDDREGQERADIKGGGARRRRNQSQIIPSRAHKEDADERAPLTLAAGIAWLLLVCSSDFCWTPRAGAVLRHSDCWLVRGSSPPALIPSECPSPSLSLEPCKVDLFHSETYKSE